MDKKYTINLIQNLTEQYVIIIYLNSKEIGRITVGLSKEEALKNAGHIEAAFQSEPINDKTA